MDNALRSSKNVLKKLRGFFLSLWLVVGTFLYVFVYGALVLFVGWLLGKERGRRFVLRQIELFGKLTFKLLGVKVHVLGQRPAAERNFLVVANHQSILDIPLVLGYVGPVAFIAKKELSKFPMVNLFIKYLGSEFIDRGNVRQTALVIRQVMKKLAEGYHFLIFPEGTRSPNGELLPFKPRSLEIAYKAGVPILPVAIWGNHRVVPKHSVMVMDNKTGIYIGELVDPTQFSSEEELRNYVQRKIAEYIEELKKFV
ncbi:lysophospholipid acyltransferase family protein [Fervidobacterium thailandense]|uniref:1-acyl-sn-glycerol-3-phosphate acyltransferase n=1 Tax=Fervidobacterium thailandense TaxID=1008305 RepID=A0A1E3G510_9BACT|nr:lysophospholipid acyltransferase family protein [Fervidobacterium thailandense]ODN31337.1 acyl-phosphate glycerol 3-phosphate acyltransferase [Fervidobacterium thailandense]